MISTTYLSTATGRWDAEALEDLLEVSRRNNADADITGVLLYSGESFLQTLEGPAETVDAVMARVNDDTRHRNVEVLRRDEIEERAFAGWSMGFREVPLERMDAIPGFTDYLRTGRLEGAETRGSAVTTLHRVFRDQMRDPLQPGGR